MSKFCMCVFVNYGFERFGTGLIARKTLLMLLLFTRGIGSVRGSAPQRFSPLANGPGCAGPYASIYGDEHKPEAILQSHRVDRCRRTQ